MAKYEGTYQGSSYTLSNALAALIRLTAGLSKEEQINLGGILGTGWNYAWQDLQKSGQFTTLAVVPFSQLFGFGGVGVEGHDGEVHVVQWHELVCVFLKGRVHLNEGPQQECNDRVRLMMELFRALSVGRIIVTNASGAYHSDFQIGDVMIAREFFDLFNQTVPFYSSESGDDSPFFYADDGIDPNMIEVVQKVAVNVEGLTLRVGSYVWSHGSYLGGRFNTKIARFLGLDAVGMSGWNEIALISKFGQAAILLCFITDIAGERSTHMDHIQRGHEASSKLGRLLNGIVKEYSTLS